MKSRFPTTTTTTTTTDNDNDATGADVGQSALFRFAAAVRRLEPAIPVSIAAATGWLAATAHQALNALWLFCLFALVVGGWAAARRAAPQVEVAARAVALLAACYVLHTIAGVPGGAAGVFFFWLGLTAIYYVFVLKGPFASLIAVAAVGEFTLAAMWMGPDALASLAAQGAYMLILPMLLAMKLGSISRRPSSRPGDARTDRSTALYNRGGLLAHGKALLADCRADGRELTLAVFDCSDLLEARTVYGDRTSRKLVDSIVRKLTLLAGDGIAARTGPTQFALAMPMSRDKAVQAIERLLGNPPRFELEGSRTEIVLVPHLMVETIPSAGTVERMFSAVCRGLSRIQEEERMRHQYLQRERERHSRPMPISADETPVVRPARPQLLDPDPVMTQQIPATIPMPLASR